MMKIKGSVWFTTMQGDIIGIVIGWDGYRDKAYIGVGKSGNQKTDEERIATMGAKFPVEIAKKMILGE